MAGFDDILSTIHNGVGTTMQDDSGKAIVINSKRMFEIPEGFDTVIGYAGDVNSQIITFQLPLVYDGHELRKCNNHKIKWKNMASGAQGISDLVDTNISNTNDHWCATWVVPIELMNKSGTIEIGISICDIVNHQKVFSWNTATYKGFSIGETFIDTTQSFDNLTFPTQNKILNIVTDTKQIIAPSGYNYTIANYGDKGVKVYFSVDANINGYNTLSDAVDISIYIHKEEFNTRVAGDSIQRTVFPTNNQKVLITWYVPEYLTCGVDNEGSILYGNFDISVCFSDTGFVWSTSTFDKLSIGESLLAEEIGEEAGVKIDWAQMVEDTVKNLTQHSINTGIIYLNDTSISDTDPARLNYDYKTLSICADNAIFLNTSYGHPAILIGSDVWDYNNENTIRMMASDKIIINTPNVHLQGNMNALEYHIGEGYFITTNQAYLPNIITTDFSCDYITAGIGEFKNGLTVEGPVIFGTGLESNDALFAVGNSSNGTLFEVTDGNVNFYCVINVDAMNLNNASINFANIENLSVFSMENYSITTELVNATNITTSRIYNEDVGITIESGKNVLLSGGYTKSICIQPDGIELCGNTLILGNLQIDGTTILVDSAALDAMLEEVYG